MPLRARAPKSLDKPEHRLLLISRSNRPQTMEMMGGSWSQAEVRPFAGARAEHTGRAGRGYLSARSKTVSTPLQIGLLVVDAVQWPRILARCSHHVWLETGGQAIPLVWFCRNPLRRKASQLRRQTRDDGAGRPPQHRRPSLCCARAVVEQLSGKAEVSPPSCPGTGLGKPIGLCAVSDRQASGGSWFWGGSAGGARQSTVSRLL